MKLKYYLRGLGIGIVVAVIITSISMGNRQPMTDEEIKARAAELGMIENSVLSDIANKDDEAIKNDEPAKDDEAIKNDEPAKDDEALQDNEPVIDEPTQDEPAQDEPTQDEPTQDEEQLEEEEKNDEPAEYEENNQQSNDKNTVSITVVSGDSSWTVSKRMEEAGLIESAKDFDTHLCRYGYDKKISVGTYKIPVTATHEEMAKILTRMD